MRTIPPLLEPYSHAMRGAPAVSNDCCEPPLVLGPLHRVPKNDYPHPVSHLDFETEADFAPGGQYASHEKGPAMERTQLAANVVTR